MAKPKAKVKSEKKMESLVTTNQAFRDQTLTAEAVNKLTDRDLRKKVGKKKAWRADSVFIEIIEHYLYHAGQINYIRCLWEGVKSK